MPASGPLTKFLGSHAAERERLFFLEAARTLWPADIAAQVDINSIVIVLPAFTVTQLREAFEIGFLLYLPFIAIDLIVSNILLAMGMMMVSPLTISLPFKLFLFVIDRRLVEADPWPGQNLRLTLRAMETSQS